MNLLRRAAAVLTATACCTLLAGTPARAKGDVRATLADPAKLEQAAPGQRVQVAFRLATAPRAGAPTHAFGASGIYVRVRGNGGGRPAIAAAEPANGARSGGDGRFVAAVTVPAGGIAAIAIGLEGFRSMKGLPTERADAFFPIVDDPFARSPAPAAAGKGGAGVGWGLGAAAAIGALSAARAGSRRSRSGRTPGARCDRA